jgi:hypothetical protein
VIRAAADPQLAGHTGVWITENNEVGEPSRTARDDNLAAGVYERITEMADGARVARQRHERPVETHKR